MNNYEKYRSQNYPKGNIIKLHVLNDFFFFSRYNKWVRRGFKPECHSMGKLDNVT